MLRSSATEWPTHVRWASGVSERLAGDALGDADGPVARRRRRRRRSSRRSVGCTFSIRRIASHSTASPASSLGGKNSKLIRRRRPGDRRDRPGEPLRPRHRGCRAVPCRSPYVEPLPSRVAPFTGRTGSPRRLADHSRDSMEDLP